VLQAATLFAVVLSMRSNHLLAKGWMLIAKSIGMYKLHAKTGRLD
jgi:hypothetical protein